jgi:hypothetical protein
MNLINFKSNTLIDTYKSIYTDLPLSCDKEYNGIIFNQSLSHICGILSILELVYQQNTLNDISNIDIISIYNYNRSKCRNNTILDFIKSIKEKTNINIYNICQCKTDNDIKDAILSNSGVILNIKSSNILKSYDRNYIINTKKKNIIYTTSNHSVFAYGYKTINNKLYLHILNTYGKSYGNNGSVYLSIDYLMNEYPYTFKSRIIPST